MIIDSFINALRTCCETFPDKRTGKNICHGMGDIGMAAFSVFFTQSPSFLSHQRALREQPRALELLEERQGLRFFCRLDGHVLIALDGTEFFTSQKIGRPHCQTRKRGNGKTENYHAMLAAALGLVT